MRISTEIKGILTEFKKVNNLMSYTENSVLKGLALALELRELIQQRNLLPYSIFWGVGNDFSENFILVKLYSLPNRSHTPYLCTFWGPFS